MNDAAPEQRTRWYGGLRARIIALISLVALPIGFIAIVQTNKLAQTADRNAELALLALSEQVIQSERLVIQRALGAAKVLTKFVPFLAAEPESCAPVLRNYTLQEPDFSFVGVVPLQGDITCASGPVTQDFVSHERWGELVETPRSNILVKTDAMPDGSSAIAVLAPYNAQGSFAGYVSILIPTTRLDERMPFDELPIDGLIELFSFNDMGEILLAENGLSMSEELLPADLSPDLFTQGVAQSFRSTALSGDDYVYTLVPVSDSPLTILGVWTPNDVADSRFLQSTLPASLFPALMWLATVLVAVMALYTMVIRHINRLRSQMVDFATTRRTPELRFDGSAPTEIVDIQNRFMDMTDDILREEARLEALVHEQKVLIKEVHHRVKNNLQMIASIMNMQIRKAEHVETVDTLQRVQDRISSLADVHKDLYSAQSDGKLNVGSLIERTLQNSIEMAVADVGAIDLHTDIADVMLFPDQAMSLSLLSGEAVTNALKYMRGHDGEKPMLRIGLRRTDDTCTLEIINTTGSQEVEQGTGIGTKLIRTFAIKLGGTSDVHIENGHYHFSIAFPVATFEPESRDF